jgi:ABC-2 type transport system ATP-binding protein
MPVSRITNPIVFSSSMITLSSVTKTFGACTAVDSVSYIIEQGEYFALLGPNGAGKTTIVRMLMGFIAPTSGTITIDGKPVSDPQSRKSVGYLAEILKIPPYLSGLEFLLRHAWFIGLSGTAARREAERVLEIVSMKGNEKKPSRVYSKGMRQRIGLGAAMLGNPKVLILDEPVSGLDPLGIRDVRKILERLHDTRVTVVINSHLLSEAEKTCTTAGIMHNGKVLIKDEIKNIVQENESLEDVFIRYVERKNA